MLRYSLMLVFLSCFLSAKAQLKVNMNHHLTALETPAKEVIELRQPSSGVLSLKGSLKQIVAFLKGVNTSQVSVSDKDNTSFELLYRQGVEKATILEGISQEIGLNIVESQRGGQILQMILIGYDKLTPSKARFPLTNITRDDEQATIAHLSLKDMLTVLSQLREVPIILLNKPQYVRNTPYDWKVSYYFDAPLLETLSQYGFKAEFKRGDYPVYTVVRTSASAIK